MIKTIDPIFSQRAGNLICFLVNMNPSDLSHVLMYIVDRLHQTVARVKTATAFG